MNQLELNPTLSPLRALWQLLLTERNRMTWALVFVITGSLMEALPWMLMAWALSLVLAGHPDELWLCALALAGAYTARNVLIAAANWQTHQAAYAIILRLRRHLVSVLASWPLDRLQRTHRADLEKRLLRDADRLEPLLAHHGVDLINAAILPLVLFGLMLAIHPGLALLALMPLPLALGLQALLMRGFAPRQQAYNDSVERLDQAMLEYLRSLTVFKVFGRDLAAYRQFSRALTDHHGLMQAFTRQLITGWAMFIAAMNAGVWLVLPVALAMWGRGQLTLPELVLSVVLSAALLRPWQAVTQLMGEVIMGLTALKDILPLTGDAGEPMPPDASTMRESVPGLRVDNLSLDLDGYPALSNVGFSLAAGETVVLMGPSGAGKSSLVHCLAGLRQPSRGRALWQGYVLNDLTDADRARTLTLVLQTPFFFRGTLKDNLCLGAPEATEKALASALNQCGLTPLLASLPDGLATDMGEAARLFSGGEQQRLAIARALLADTPVLILDEATAHLDAESEERLLTRLMEDRPHQTRLIVSHRPAAARRADRVILMDAGRILDQGTHTDLLERNPSYRTLVNRHSEDAHV